MNNLLKNNFKKKKVLITGNTGFKGSWLTLWLIKMGAYVYGYSNPAPTNPSLFEILSLEDRITHEDGDVTDYKHLKDTITSFEPEVIFHLAAQPLVRESYLQPLKTYETNVMGTVNLLEAVRITEIPKIVINVTSDKCYENKEWYYGYRENDPMGGKDPYSSSKGCSELVTSAYRDSFFNENSNSSKISLASVRAGNVIGGGDWAEDRLIPDCIKSLHAHQEINIRSPRAIRPWQHVFDAINGYVTLASYMMENSNKFASAWNFGPDNDSMASVEKVVRKIIHFWGEGDYNKDHNEGPHEASLLKLDISKSLSSLSWKPTYALDEALEKTISWYKTFYNDEEDMYEYSINQICSFIDKSQKNFVKLY